jgi:Protein O-mannosyl-transferase TMEM260-like
MLAAMSMHRTRWSDRWIATAVGLLALLIYLRTLTPSLSYLSPDGSELATVPAVLGLAHPPGYPLYTWLGFLFSRLLQAGDVAHRMNMMSAALGALGVGALYLILIRLLPSERLGLLWRRVVAALSALLFAFSLTFWSQAVIAEVYAPNIGLVGLTLVILLRWERTRHLLDFFVFALVFGLSLGTHMSNLGFAPALALFALLTAFTPREESDAAGRMPTWSRRALGLAGLILVGGLGFALGAAQFLWLPLRASTINDPLSIRIAPVSLGNLYQYTLGAFTQLRFAFPLGALPDRVVIYIYFLIQQSGLPGLLLGVAGMVSLLVTRPRHFYLVLGMYLVNVWFFTQYRAFDLEVFFIPAHYLWAILIAFGLMEGLHAIGWLAIRLGLRLGSGCLSSGARAGLAVLILLPSLTPLRRNWAKNDLSSDTAINDFYANVWERLPADSALVTARGVFGYDAFYWQLVYDTRDDVLLPLLPTPTPSPVSLAGREVFGTTRTVSSQGGMFAPPAGLTPAESWVVPVLLGQQPERQIGRREQLVLYRYSEAPPQLAVREATPSVVTQADFGPAILVGAHISSTSIESGQAIDVTLYWRSQAPVPLRVILRLGSQTLEQHEVGFGLLSRYAKEVGIGEEDLIVDRYAVIIPSTVQPGLYALTLAPQAGQSQAVIESAGAALGTLEVVNETEAMEQWLTAAGLSSPER